MHDFHSLKKGEASGRQLRILVVMSVPCDRPGGLAAVAGMLACGLEARGHSGAVLLTEGGEAMPGLFPQNWRRFRFSKKRGYLSRLWSSVASRPALHGPGLAWIANGWIAEGLGGPFDAVIYLGAGWNFSGFAAAKLARGWEAAFLVWPAVHAGVWGDDRVDLRLYALADRVWIQSEFERRHLVGLGLDEGRMGSMRLPAACRSDGDGLRFRVKHGLGDDLPLVLFLGRRETGKGYSVLLEAWPLVMAEMPEARLLLAGPSGESQRADLDGVLDLGTPDETEKADALAACSLFCLPSAEESYGVVFVEAWVYGKAVICGPAEPSRELVKAAGGGIAVSQNPEELAAAILTLLRDAERCRAMGAAGKAYAQRHLSLSGFLDGVEQELLETIAGR